MHERRRDTLIPVDFKTVYQIEEARMSMEDVKDY
jgi:hypothetical protein